MSKFFKRFYKQSPKNDMDQVKCKFTACLIFFDGSTGLPFCSKKCAIKNSNWIKRRKNAPKLKEKKSETKMVQVKCKSKSCPIFFDGSTGLKFCSKECANKNLKKKNPKTKVLGSDGVCRYLVKMEPNSVNRAVALFSEGYGKGALLLPFLLRKEGSALRQTCREIKVSVDIKPKWPNDHLDLYFQFSSSGIESQTYKLYFDDFFPHSVPKDIAKDYQKFQKIIWDICYKHFDYGTEEAMYRGLLSRDSIESEEFIITSDGSIHSTDPRYPTQLLILIQDPEVAGYDSQAILYSNLAQPKDLGKIYPLYFVNKDLPLSAKKYLVQKRLEKQAFHFV